MGNCNISRDVPFSTIWQPSDCSDTVNGEDIYYNLTNSVFANCACVAGFKADPDVAGPGVMTSFIATAFLTLFVTVVDLFCSMSSSCKKYLDKHAPSTGTKKADIKQFLQASWLSTSPTWRTTEHLHPLAKLGLFVSRCPQPLPAILQHVAPPVILVFSREHPKAKRFAELALDLLCDIQVVTGLAILISGLVQLREMSYYHQQFVLNYFFLALNSFWAARAGALNQDAEAKEEEEEDGKGDESGDGEDGKTKDEDGGDGGTWHYWTRTTAIFCCMVLSVAYQILVIPEQKRNRSPVLEKRCFISHDRSQYDQQYLWLASTIVYAGYLGFVLSVGLVWRDLKFVKELSQSTVEREAAFRGWLKTQRNALMDGSRLPVARVAIYVLFAALLGSTYAASIFLGILAWGDSKSVLVVAFYFGFVGWNTYNIIDMKLSNAHLVDQAETEWGFGQCLAVGVLVLVVLNCGDAWKEASKETSTSTSTSTSRGTSRSKSKPRRQA